MANVFSHVDHRAMNWTPERMLSRLDGDTELATQLAAIFIDEYPRMLERLRGAVASGSADDVRRAAHALKGSVSNFVDGGPTATALRTGDHGAERSARRHDGDPRSSRAGDRCSDSLPAGLSIKGDGVCGAFVMSPASKNQAAQAFEEFQKALVRDQIVTGVGLERALQHSRAVRD